MIHEQFDRLAIWQKHLIERLEAAMSRPITTADLTCVMWNVQAHTLTVQSIPLLTELRARNLVSNVFRTFSPRRRGNSAPGEL